MALCRRHRLYSRVVLIRLALVTSIRFEDAPHRVWMTSFLANPTPVAAPTAPGQPIAWTGQGLFVDLFRFFHPDERGAFTCWNQKVPL